MIFKGTIADINAALEGATFVAAQNHTGSASLQITTNDLGNSGAGGALSDTDTVDITVQAVQTSLWLSTLNDVASPGATGLDSWTGGQVIEFGESGGTLAFEPGTTTGAFSPAAFDLDNAAFGDANTQLDGIHYVTRDFTAGGIALQQGDVLFSVTANETLDGVAYEGGTSSCSVPPPLATTARGRFPCSSTRPTPASIVEGFTLVEHDTTVGDVTLSAGELLLVNGGRDVLRFEPTQLGETTSGAQSVLIDGDGSLALGKNISALELVEHTSVIGDKTLPAGTLILALEGEETDGTPLNVTRWDLFTLDVSTTGNGTTTATAELLLEGADVQLDTNNEAITGISLFPNQAPAVENQIFAVDENSTNGTVVGTVIGDRP